MYYEFKIYEIVRSNIDDIMVGKLLIDAPDEILIDDEPYFDSWTDDVKEYQYLKENDHNVVLVKHKTTFTFQP